MGSIARRTRSDVSLLNRGRLACGLAEKATINHGGRSEASEPSCDGWPAQWKAWAQDLAPNVSVVIFDVFVVQDIEVGGKQLTFNTPASDRYLLKQLDRGVKALLSTGAPVALVTSPYNHRPETVGQPVRWDEDNPARIDHWNALLRRFITAHPNDALQLIDLNHYLSPKGTYTNVRDGVTLRYDGVHFNPEAGVLIFRWMAPQLPGSPTSTATTVPGATATTTDGANPTTASSTPATRTADLRSCTGCGSDSGSGGGRVYGARP